MSLKGAMKVFGDIFIDIIVSVLLGRTVVLCNDIDIAITLYNTISRVVAGGATLGKEVWILEDCAEAPDDSFVVNCRYSVLVRGTAEHEARKTISRYLSEAVTVGDNEAAVLFIRQKISALLRAADILESEIKGRTLARKALTIIESKSGITVRYDDLHIVLAILRSRGRDDIVESIVMGQLDGF